MAYNGKCNDPHRKLMEEFSVVCWNATISKITENKNTFKDKFTNIRKDTTPLLCLMAMIKSWDTNFFFLHGLIGMIGEMTSSQEFNGQATSVKAFFIIFVSVSCGSCMLIIAGYWIIKKTKTLFSPKDRLIWGHLLYCYRIPYKISEC